MLDDMLDLFATTRARTHDLVRDLCQAEADARPAPDRWSVGEVLDHLLLAERFSRGEVQLLIDMGRAGRESVLRRGFAEFDISVAPIPRAVLALFTLPLNLANRFVPRFVRDFLLTSRLVPARHPKAATPRPGRSVEVLRRELVDSLRQTTALFQANADLDFQRLRHVHPVLGWNDMPALLRIVALHEQRHQRAIAATRRSWPRRAVERVTA